MQEFFLAYARGAEAMTQTYFPFFKGATRVNLEAMCFVNRRAQAHLELTARLGQCRTPHDLFEVQARFWREAAEQYADSSRKMLDTWTQAATSPAQLASGGKDARRQDYIPFPEPKTPRPVPRAARRESNGSGARSRAS